jgi:signal transduction histidine kinase
VQTRNGDLLVTVPVLEGGRVVGAVRVARAMSQVDRRTVRRNLGLAGLALLALTIGTGVAALLATRLTHPLRRFELVARRFGEGDVDVRAPEPSGRELAALAGSFNTMADSITANMQAQRDFAANASHQLKTPLTALRLRLDAIADETGVDPVGEASKALGDVVRLDALVTDLLDLAHAETPVGLPEPFDLGELVSDVAERWTETATRRGKQLRVVIDVPAVVTAVEDDIEQVLDNLVDNAIRYSGTGAHITLEAVGAAARVCDDGPGIPDDERARVFERFFRGRTGRATTPGTGLGLAIVAALVRRSGGDVRLLPSPGTRIEVRLPAA